MNTRYAFVIDAARHRVPPSAPSVLHVTAPDIVTARSLALWHLDQEWFDGRDGSAILELDIRDAGDLGEVEASAGLLWFIDRLFDGGGFRYYKIPSKPSRGPLALPGGLGDGRMGGRR